MAQSPNNAGQKSTTTPKLVVAVRRLENIEATRYACGYYSGK